MRNWFGAGLVLTIGIGGCGHLVTPPVAPLTITPAQVQAAALVRSEAMMGSAYLSRTQIQQVVPLLGRPAPEVQVPRQYTAGCLAFQGGNYTAAIRLHLEDGRTVDVSQVEICYPAPDVSDSDIDVGLYPFGPVQTYASPALAHLLTQLVASAG